MLTKNSWLVFSLLAAASFVTPACYAQTLLDLAGAQASKQAQEIKPPPASVVSSTAGGLGAIIRAKPPTTPIPPKPQGPVVHSIIKHGGSFQIELAHNGRLFPARIGMTFGQYIITGLDATGVTLEKNTPSLETKSATEKPTKKSKANKAPAKPSNTHTTSPDPITKTVRLGGAI